MSGRFLFLLNTAEGRPRFLDRITRHRVYTLQQYELDRLRLEEFHALFLTIHADQRHLLDSAARLDAYLDAGGAIVFNGHVAQRFLPELSHFVPIQPRGLESYRIHREAEHPLFAGVGSDVLTFQRGVAGFYGRGSNPPPPGALVLNSIGPERRPVDWLVTRPSGGRLFVHTGNDLFSFLVNAEPERSTIIRRFFDLFAE